MLDKRTARLLKKINELSADGAYKVVEEEELLSSLPAHEEGNEALLHHSLNYLCDHKYVEIKYAENGVYCLCSLPEGRAYCETEQKERGDVFRRRRDIIALSAVGAFVGGFAGGMVAWLISSLL